MTITTGMRASDIPADEPIPLGTRIEQRYVYREDGWVDEHSGNTYPTEMLGSYYVTSVGEGFATPPTYLQFIQRFMTITWGRAAQSGVSMAPIERAFEDLGLRRQSPRLGMWVHPSDSPLMNDLPTGTFFRALGTPWIGYVRSGVRRGLGLPGYISSQALEVIAFPPDFTPREWAPPTDSDAREILAFKRTVWEKGLELKASQSWCGDFENAMGRLGITERTVRRRDGEQPTEPESEVADWSPGDVLTVEQVNALPEGSIVAFMEPENTEQRGLYVVEGGDVGGSAARRTRTHRHHPSIGRAGGHHLLDAGNNWTIQYVWGPETRLGYPADRQWLAQVPAGSLVESGGLYWRKVDDTYWERFRPERPDDRTRERITHTSTLFVAPHLLHIPGVATPDGVGHDLGGVTVDLMQRAPVGSEITQHPGMRWVKSGPDRWVTIGERLGITNVDSSRFSVGALVWANWGPRLAQ